jgi:hypothetical protein
MDAFDLTDLTVLLGLVRRAKANAEKRWQRRQSLNRQGSVTDPARTKVNKLTRLLAKLEALQGKARQAPVRVPSAPLEEW